MIPLVSFALSCQSDGAVGPVLMTMFGDVRCTRPSTIEADATTTGGVGWVRLELTPPEGVIAAIDLGELATGEWAVSTEVPPEGTTCDEAADGYWFHLVADAGESCPMDMEFSLTVLDTGATD